MRVKSASPTSSARLESGLRVGTAPEWIVSLVILVSLKELKHLVGVELDIRRKSVGAVVKALAGRQQLFLCPAGNDPASEHYVKTARRKKKNQRAAAATDIARRAPGHPRTHRSTIAAAMPALQKMDLRRKAA